MESLLYALPALPVAGRLLVALRFRRYMREELREEALDRTDHRTIVVALAGFSFAGLLGLVAIPGELEERKFAIWYVFVSFLCLLVVLNLQSYKARRWHDILGDALLEAASLALIASVTVFIAQSKLPCPLRIACIILATVVWACDFLIRVRLTMSFLQDKESSDDERKEASRSEQTAER